MSVGYGYGSQKTVKTKAMKVFGTSDAGSAALSKLGSSHFIQGSDSIMMTGVSDAAGAYAAYLEALDLLEEMKDQGIDANDKFFS